MKYRILPPDFIIDTAPLLPLSKSESARTVIMDTVAGCTTDVGLAQCDDTNAIVAGARATRGEVNVGLAGTALRFLTALYAATPDAEVVLTGEPRLLERPLAALIDALRALGADIRCLGTEGHAPLAISGRQLSGGRVCLPAGVSSQFVSALMMVAPMMQAPLEIALAGDPVSAPYIHMTAEMMRRRGIEVDADLRAGIIRIPHAQYNRLQLPIGRDWSAASYWYSIAALTAGWVTLEGLELNSLQGDAHMAEYAQMLGVVTDYYDPDEDSDDEEDDDEPDSEIPRPAKRTVSGDALQLEPSPEVFSRIELDMSDTPDLVQTLVVTACMLGIPFRFTGVSTLAGKETDRLAALRAELAKVGFVIDIAPDLIAWEGARTPVTELPVFDTYNDHRMAMALAPVAVYIPGIVINDPEVVSKSYPGYWDDLRDAGFTVTPIDENLQ